MCVPPCVELVEFAQVARLVQLGGGGVLAEVVVVDGVEIHSLDEDEVVPADTRRRCRSCSQARAKRSDEAVQLQVEDADQVEAEGRAVQPGQCVLRLRRLVACGACDCIVSG